MRVLLHHQLLPNAKPSHHSPMQPRWQPHQDRAAPHHICSGRVNSGKRTTVSGLWNAALADMPESDFTEIYRHIADKK